MAKIDDLGFNGMIQKWKVRNAVFYVDIAGHCQIEIHKIAYKITKQNGNILLGKC